MLRSERLKYKIFNDQEQDSVLFPMKFLSLVLGMRRMISRSRSKTRQFLLSASFYCSPRSRRYQLENFFGKHIRPLQQHEMRPHTEAHVSIARHIRGQIKSVIHSSENIRQTGDDGCVVRQGQRCRRRRHIQTRNQLQQMLCVKRRPKHISHVGSRIDSEFRRAPGEEGNYFEERSHG